jgi:(p)ppGpp synthase/HD superfamily hydrolase
MSTITKALRIALDAHEGVKDKAGQDYILHPLRVALKQKTDIRRIIGILHDTIEDTRDNPDEAKRVTLETLRAAGFSERVLAGLDSVTRRPGEKYLSEFIPRCRNDPDGIYVKLADLEDNMDPDRAMKIPGAESLLKKYQKAKDTLETRLDIERREKELKRLRETEGA